VGWAIASPVVRGGNPLTRVLTLFRVRGIPVRIHPSWLVIVGLITWSLSVGYFPQILPSVSLRTHWAQGFLGALLLFGSVLLHELSHALTAQRYGIPVSGVTLHVFGGVSQLSREPDRPGEEFAIAIVGPLTSFAIAGVLAVLRSLTQPPVAVAAVMSYLILVNTVVGVFNLAPGFPLDGGRLLRAVLWRARGDLGWATRVAGRAGGMFAMFLIALGAFRALGGQFLDGLWLILIGLFLRQGAEGSSRQMALERVLAPLAVRDGMTPTVITVPPDLSITTAVDDFFWRHHVSSFPVVEGDHLVGIIAVDGLKQLPRECWATTSVRDLMLPVTDALMAAPDDSLWSALQKLSQNGLGRLAVVHHGRLAGYLSIKDVTHLIAVSK
jgi:Zn-dependent protease/predicted transcriptional regulator